MAKYVMALDAGTTSNRCILFNERGEMCSVAQREFKQYFPKPGWVEHDADEIWASMLGVAVEAMSRIGATAADIAAIGRGIAGAKRYFLQNFKDSGDLIGNGLHPVPTETLLRMKNAAFVHISHVGVRGL